MHVGNVLNAETEEEKEGDVNNLTQSSYDVRTSLEYSLERRVGMFNETLNWNTNYNDWNDRLEY